MLDRFNGERPEVTHIYDKPTHLFSFDRLDAHRRHIIATYLEVAGLTQTNIPTGRFLTAQLLEDLRSVQDFTDIDIATILEGLPAANGQLLTSDIVTWRECTFDPATGIGKIHDRESELRRLEGRIFHTLVQNGDKVVSYPRLIETVWQYPVHAGNLGALLKTHVSHIRKKLDDPDKPSHIVGRIGIGYHLKSCSSFKSFPERNQPQLPTPFSDSRDRAVADDSNESFTLPLETSETIQNSTTAGRTEELTNPAKPTTDLLIPESNFVRTNEDLTEEEERFIFAHTALNDAGTNWRNSNYEDIIVTLYPGHLTGNSIAHKAFFDQYDEAYQEVLHTVEGKLENAQKIARDRPERLSVHYQTLLDQLRKQHGILLQFSHVIEVLEGYYDGAEGLEKLRSTLGKPNISV